jgi:heat shock protein HslJ
VTAGVCPPAAVEQERVVLQVLGDGFRAEVDGDRLTLTSRGGDGLVYRAR